MKRLLIATDGSKASEVAIEEGTELAREPGATVTFVYVKPWPPGLLGESYYQRKLTKEAAGARDVANARRRRPSSTTKEIPSSATNGAQATSKARNAHPRLLRPRHRTQRRRRPR